MDVINKLSFHERIQNMLVVHLPNLNGSQLMCFQVISYLTTRVNLEEVAINLYEFEAVTGLSRKTIISSLRKLSEMGFIEIENSNLSNRYSVNREYFQELRTENKQSEILNGVINTHRRMEELHFDGVLYPLDIKKVLNIWNTYMYKRLDIADKMHVKYVQGCLKRYSIKVIMNALAKFINDENLGELTIDDSFLRDFFGFKEE